MNYVDLNYVDLNYVDLNYVDLNYVDLNYVDLNYVSTSSEYCRLAPLRSAPRLPHDDDETKQAVGYISAWPDCPLCGDISPVAGRPSATHLVFASKKLMAKTTPTDESPRTNEQMNQIREIDEYCHDLDEITKSVTWRPGDPHRPFFDFLSQDEQNEILQQYCGCDADQVSVEVLVAARQSFDLSL